jgi:predicted nucleic acid-binding protein
MANSSSDNLAPLVIDTSVAINLEASGLAVEILSALGRSIVIVDIVPGELDGGRGYGPKVQAAIADWKRQKLVELVVLSDEANVTFEELISGSAASTLDDGEAATMAYALEIGATAVIDEVKARRISAERYPLLAISSSTDLFLSPLVAAVLGEAGVCEALFKALTVARMRVPAERQAEVVRLLGRERILLCHSLPASVRSRA